MLTNVDSCKSLLLTFTLRYCLYATVIPVTCSITVLFSWKVSYFHKKCGDLTYHMIRCVGSVISCIIYCRILITIGRISNFEELFKTNKDNKDKTKYVVNVKRLVIEVQYRCRP